jgi:sarcosine oxidase
MTIPAATGPSPAGPSPAGPSPAVRGASDAPKAHDVIVVGRGGMGSAAAAELAGRGLRVLGLDRFGPAHDRGSSHGESRVIRQAYFEGPAYVPLLLRAYERWRELEAATGKELLTETGGLMIGPEGSRTVAGSRLSAVTWDLPHELLDAPEITRRFPTLTPGQDDVGLYERHAGFVRPEATVAAHIGLARSRGAELHFDETVTGWESRPGGVVVTTPLGAYRAARLVLSAGAWAPDLLDGLGIPLRVERLVQFWFRPTIGVEQFAPSRQPIYVWEDAAGAQVYGFPALGAAADGVKAAFFRRSTPTVADELARQVGDEEAVPLLDFLAHRIPALGPEVCRAVPCMYTTTPDEDFVLGYPRGEENVVICSPCSGHGFKFVPVIGEVVADLVTSGSTGFDISLFDPARFDPARSAKTSEAANAVPTDGGMP